MNEWQNSHPSYGYRRDPNQYQLFNEKDYATRRYEEAPKKDENLKKYAHELGMIKDLITAVLNRIDAIEEMVSVQTETLDEISDLLFEQ